MNIDEMPAGPELDALVAEKVMGWKRHSPDWNVTMIPANSRYTSAIVPHYSTDIAAAWPVVEKLQGLGFEWVLKSNWAAGVEQFGGPVSFTLYDPKRSEYFNINGGADTAPLAICRAALKAVTL